MESVTANSIQIYGNSQKHSENFSNFHCEKEKLKWLPKKRKQIIFFIIVVHLMHFIVIFKRESKLKLDIKVNKGKRNKEKSFFNDK